MRATRPANTYLHKLRVLYFADYEIVK